MTDHARLRRMCAARADIPRGDVLALLDELELLAEDHDDLSRTLAYRENQLTAANAAARGYRQRAERAEALLASHAGPVATGDAGSPRDALGGGE